MGISELEGIKERFERDGYVSGVRIMDEEEAAGHRRRMEEAEEQIGNMHYRMKIYTVTRATFELVSHPRVLDVVEAIIGPNILLHNATFLIKEPHSKTHVSWHQDLTYWGFDSTDVVSLWLALAKVDELSGGMRMIPGSHKQGRCEHSLGDDPSNILLQSQTVRGVDESLAQPCPLRPGEASFHHSWTLHASEPNNSDDRRIGFNVQYIAPHVRQTKHDGDTTILLRGVDEHRHFGEDTPATEEIDFEALEKQKELDRLYREVAGH